MRRAVTIVTTTLMLATGAQAQTQTAEDALERLKALAGTWTGERSLKGQEGSRPAHVTYRVTAGGTAVMETIAPGTPHEMVTMYHIDREHLQLTHYCSVGNQPRMRARLGDDAKELIFAYAGGSNLDASADDHMRRLVIRFRDADHLQNEWTSYKGGMASGTVVFHLTRSGS